MTIKHWLLSFQGRIGRQRFWMWNLFYYLVMLAIIGIAAQNLFGSFTGVAIFIMSAALLVPDLAVTAKRWHDRNKSNWWLLMHVPLIAGRLMAPIGGAETVEPSMMQTSVSIVAIVCGVWMLVECGLLKGSQGDNRYGPEPTNN
ncbi:DUF805 domain-containing protein [Vibrio litoralis]|uniref:DUF805 domain-containing protein n=1 Tax=Vibrio litoralis TaxID=335972 RepID=UPI0004098CC2|nr:DUF805 domain-containing protein [Vibrio litoralis]